ncbi:hypothetical protein GDO78_014939 [Eleutherodactylus coqui]|uniref:Uncharacterized protein n=1 Tax=Eleutherodactylus coqui TaxID=57060 RepID=A0A8J6C3N4_ELECQ|nr:hypothetical protein GDO78_014939 [Eleutherodactylus coqui]
MSQPETASVSLEEPGRNRGELLAPVGCGGPGEVEPRRSERLKRSQENGSTGRSRSQSRSPQRALEWGTKHPEEGGTSTSEADTGGKDFAGSSKGGCLRSEVHRVKSPLNLSLFSFGDDSPPEDMYSKKKKIVEMKPLGWEEACGN